MEKKRPNYFVKGITLVFIIYIFLYMAINNGYYESELRNEVVITNENIDMFEADIKSGKPIDLKKYKTFEQHDYGNIFSNSGNYIGNKLDYIVNVGLFKTGKILKKLFTNN